LVNPDKRVKTSIGISAGKFEASSHAVNGGTVFEPWIGKALALEDGSRFEKAGVICVSDGISDASPEDQAKWTRKRTNAVCGHTESLKVCRPF